MLHLIYIKRSHYIEFRLLFKFLRLWCQLFTNYVLVSSFLRIFYALLLWILRPNTEWLPWSWFKWILLWSFVFHFLCDFFGPMSFFTSFKRWPYVYFRLLFGRLQITKIGFDVSCCNGLIIRFQYLFRRRNIWYCIFWYYYWDWLYRILSYKMTRWMHFLFRYTDAK
jgi:hypothetical protein